MRPSFLFAIALGCTATLTTTVVRTAADATPDLGTAAASATAEQGVLDLGLGRAPR